MTPAHIITEDSVTVVIDGESYTVRSTSPNFQAAREAAFLNQWERIPELATPGLAIEQWLNGAFSLVEGHICYNGLPVDAALSERMKGMAANGADPSSWFKFWERLQNNPSRRSVQQLYTFMAQGNIPIDEDTGHILAYKSVRRNYLDHHSGTYDNSPGAVLEMPRNQISDDPRVACHEGFHVGGLEYASSFGTDKRLIVVSVDPADVVCVPYDHSFGKMRVCRYSVVGNYSGEPLPDAYVAGEEGEDFEDEDFEDESSEDFEDESSEDFEDEASEEPEATPAQAPGTWHELDRLDSSELSKQPLSVLRRYARFGLEIYRASKLPGGKEALVKRILEVRKN